MINTETIPVYIRFGEIPENERSKVYQGNEVLCEEAGVSVWECVKANGQYYPVLPKEVNESGIADYFDFILNNDKPIYLVVGNRILINGHDNEPLLRNVKVIKKIVYNKT